MFPDTITIYRHSIENGEDLYQKQVKDGFYWNVKNKRVNESKGAVSESELTVISSPKRAFDYEKSWNVKVGDIIIKGKGDNISTLKELDNYFTVFSVEENLCGSVADNIVISGK